MIRHSYKYLYDNNKYLYDNNNRGNDNTGIIEYKYQRNCKNLVETSNVERANMNIILLFALCFVGK